MAKVNKEEEARRSGMAYALKVIMDAQQSGCSDTESINKLREELKFRNITKAPIGTNQQDVREFIDQTKHNCTVTFSLLTVLTLHDVFGFGKVRLDRFLERFNLKAECLVTPDCEVSWKDYQEIVEDECHIKIDLTGDFLTISREEN